MGGERVKAPSTAPCLYLQPQGGQGRRSGALGCGRGQEGSVGAIEQAAAANADALSCDRGWQPQTCHNDGRGAPWQRQRRTWAAWQAATHSCSSVRHRPWVHACRRNPVAAGPSPSHQQQAAGQWCTARQTGKGDALLAASGQRTVPPSRPAFHCRCPRPVPGTHPVRLLREAAALTKVHLNVKVAALLPGSILVLHSMGRWAANLRRCHACTSGLHMCAGLP